MGKLILYGVDLSPPVRAVKLTLKALNIDYEYRILNFQAGEHLKPEFLSINPQHTVPTINDNGHILWESNAIVTYLVTKYGQDDSLYTEDVYKRSRIDQRLNFFNGILFPRLIALARPIFSGIATEYNEDAVKNLMEAFGFMEIFLKDDPYIAGQTLTVADFSFSACMESLIRVLTIDESKFPKMMKWLKKLTTTISYYDEINVKPVENIRKILDDKLVENRKAKGL